MRAVEIKNQRRRPTPLAKASVTSLAEFKARDTVAVLTVLLEQASRGGLDGGIAVVVKPQSGAGAHSESIFVTGDFAAGQDAAIGAISRLWARVVQVGGGPGFALRR